LHRVVRGAEVAFESVAAALARLDGIEVTLFGSGQERPGEPYRFVHAGCLPREKFESWPKVPVLRHDVDWEELSFLPGFLRRFRPDDFDVVVTCSYPLQSWCVRARSAFGRRPLHVFVTQNGDWPLYRKNSEYRLFDCDALVCTNPDYFDAHATKWHSMLIPNGVDCSLFHPGAADRSRFGLATTERVVLMVSALIPSKRVLEGVRAVAAVPGASLVVAGDGELRDEVDALGKQLLGTRFRRLRVARADMPVLYRSANAFLHMSIDEPSANAYCEALASGLPIVTHDRRVTRWTLREHAHFVDALDTASVVAGLAAALSSEGRAEVRAADAQARFDWSGIAERYAQFFEEALHRRV
jgi:glycosyltransferase involved in cell wall biosynthesis